MAARGSSGIRGGIGGLGRESSAPECGIRPERGSGGESGRRRVSVGLMPAGGGAGRAGPGTEAERGGNGGAAGRAGTRAGRRGARAVAGRVVGVRERGGAGCRGARAVAGRVVGVRERWRRVVGARARRGRGAVVGVVECAVGRTSRAPVHGTRPELDGVNVSRWGARNVPEPGGAAVSWLGSWNVQWGGLRAPRCTQRAPNSTGSMCHGGERGMPPNPAGPRRYGRGREMCSGADFARPGARNAPRT